MVVSDAVLLDGILRNLVHNAVKYTPLGGRILVGCRRRRSHVRIEVHDTGVGIPPEHLCAIFSAFRRNDATGADGIGLGLFIVRRAARASSRCPAGGRPGVMLFHPDRARGWGGCWKLAKKASLARIMILGCGRGADALSQSTKQTSPDNCCQRPWLGIK